GWLDASSSRLQALGGRAPFALARLHGITAPTLCAALRERGIVLRDASNFVGLDERYVRVAARTVVDLLYLQRELRAHLGDCCPPPMARALMIQGTASHAGKSVLTAAFGRWLRDRGLRVAPFKAQNMSLNSYVTLRGEEIARSQAAQAEALGLEPTADM